MSVADDRMAEGDFPFGGCLLGVFLPTTMPHRIVSD